MPDTLLIIYVDRSDGERLGFIHPYAQPRPSQHAYQDWSLGGLLTLNPTIPGLPIGSSCVDREGEGKLMLPGDAIEG